MDTLTLIYITGIAALMLLIWALTLEETEEKKKERIRIEETKRKIDNLYNRYYGKDNKK